MQNFNVCQVDDLSLYKMYFFRMNHNKKLSSETLLVSIIQKIPAMLLVECAGISLY